MNGTVYWLTGLSGAGKTTVGELLYGKLRERSEAVVFLDGDVLREVFGDDLGYTREDRHRCAMRYARICRMLAGQGLDVVCCTISMFEDVRQWNRENIPGYHEVYLRVSGEVLSRRNQKGLYASSKDELVGFGVEMEEPEHPDLIIDNDGEISPEEVLKRVMEAFEL